mgnify:CR=1 FL=1
MDEKFSWEAVKHEPVFYALMAILTAATVFLVLYPVLRVVLYPPAALYLGFAQNARWLGSLRNSIVMMLLSMVTCTLLAFLFAYTIIRLPVPCKRLFRFVTLLPIVSPPFIVSLSYILLFGAQGLISKQLLGLHTSIYGWKGLWLVQTVTFFPYAYAVIESVMTRISGNLEYAAGNLGADRRHVFFDVFWPLCRPGVAGGAMMAAINVLADFGNPVMIGGNFSLLPTEAYMQMTGWYDMNNAAVLSTVLLLPTVSIFLFDRYWLGRRSYVTVTGKESSLPPAAAHPAAKWSAFAGCIFASLFVLAVYGVLCLGAFTKTWGYGWSPDLTNFSYVWAQRGLLYNSLRYAAESALLSSVMGLSLAYLVQRRLRRAGGALDFLALLPGAVPGVFLGIGFSIALGGKPFHLAGTGLLMALALTIWNIPTCYSADTAGLQQLGRSIEDAARNVGASSIRCFLDIIFPLLRGSFLSGFLLSFLRSMTCLSVVIFLYSAKTSVSTISILSLVNSGEWSSAAAFTLVIIAVSFALTGAFRLAADSFRWNRRETNG